MKAMSRNAIVAMLGALALVAMAQPVQALMFTFDGTFQQDASIPNSPFFNGPVGFTGTVTFDTSVVGVLTDADDDYLFTNAVTALTLQLGNGLGISLNSPTNLFAEDTGSAADIIIEIVSSSDISFFGDTSTATFDALDFNNDLRTFSLTAIAIGLEGTDLVPPDSLAGLDLSAFPTQRDVFLTYMPNAPFAVGPGISIISTGYPGEIDAQSVAVATIPEPATIALFGFGLAGLGLVARRRRR